MILHTPLILILVPLTAAALVYAHRRREYGGLIFSSREPLEKLGSGLKVILSRNLYLARIAALALITVALARPQSPVADSRVRSEGIDIVLALDTSTSMLAEDFKLGGKRQNRVDVVKDVVRDFIRGRKNDRIGIIAFAARGYVISPLTLDYNWLLQNLERVKAGMIEDGTAIGSGIASSLNRLRETTAKSKIVILLTDGRNNAGDVAPVTAAEAAKALGIRVYTIGAGSKGPVPYPARDFFGRLVYQQIEIDLDEDLLEKVASITGGRYFRATDTESLRAIYKEIDSLEKTPMEERGYEEYRELFPYFLVPGLIVLLLEIILGNTLLRRLP